MIDTRTSDFSSIENEMIMESLLDRITINPKICHGKPTVRGLRYTVQSILEMLASGMTYDELLDDYEDLEKEDFQACLLYASRVISIKNSISLVA